MIILFENIVVELNLALLIVVAVGATESTYALVAN
jgi:hypothetical protein